MLDSPERKQFEETIHFTKDKPSEEIVEKETSEEEERAIVLDDRSPSPTIRSCDNENKIETMDVYVNKTSDIRQRLQQWKQQQEHREQRMKEYHATEELFDKEIDLGSSNTVNDQDVLFDKDEDPSQCDLSVIEEKEDEDTNSNAADVQLSDNDSLHSADRSMASDHNFEEEEKKEENDTQSTVTDSMQPETKDVLLNVDDSLINDKATESCQESTNVVLGENLPSSDTNDEDSKESNNLSEDGIAALGIDEVTISNINQPTIQPKNKKPSVTIQTVENHFGLASIDPEMKSSLRTPTETQYDSPRSIRRKNELKMWQDQRRQKSETTPPANVIDNKKGRGQNLQNSSISSTRTSLHTPVEEERQDFPSRRPKHRTRVTIKTDSRLLSHTASTAARDKSLTPKKVDGKRSGSIDKFHHVKSKLHSPTAASIARNTSTAERRASPMKSDSKFILERSISSPYVRKAQPRPPQGNRRSLSSLKRTRNTTNRTLSPTSRSLPPTSRTLPPTSHTDTTGSKTFVRKSPKFPLKRPSSKMTNRKATTPARRKSQDDLQDNSKNRPLERSQEGGTNVNNIQDNSPKKRDVPNVSKTVSRAVQTDIQLKFTEETSSLSHFADQTGSDVEQDDLNNTNRRQAVTSTISSDSSEGDISLNTYHYDNNRRCASNQLLHQENKGGNLIPSQALKQMQEEKADSLQIERSSSTGSNPEIQAQNCINELVHMANNCTFDNVWANITKRDRSLCYDGRDRKQKESKVEEELPKDILNFGFDTSLQMKRKGSNANFFFKEWPKNATEKNEKAKELIEEAYKNLDVESMAKICHKFREEFTVARFYIGVLKMEKVDLEKKLVTLSDSLQDRTDDHDSIDAENKQLKEQIIELHNMLDANDSSTQESMRELEREMSETLEYAMNKAKGLQKELEMSHLKKQMLEFELNKVSIQ